MIARSIFFYMLTRSLFLTKLLQSVKHGANLPNKLAPHIELFVDDQASHLLVPA